MGRLGAELAEPFELTPRAISKHIGVLESAGLVSRDRDAQRRPSRLRVEPLLDLDAWLGDYRAVWEHRFAPPGYATLRFAADPRPGGAWRLDFRSEGGEHEYSEQGVYREVEPSDRLVLTLTQVDGTAANPLTVATVLLEEVGDAEAPRTRTRFTQSGYESRRLREDNEQGWRGCLTALARDLEVAEESAEPGGPAASSGESESSGDDPGRSGPAEAERELRELFEAWFEASERKDVDAQMEPIAEGIVSYGHEAPQERRGIDAVRAVGAAGAGG